MSDLEYTDTEQFTRNETKRQIPLIIFLIGIGLTGTVGNILVYLVYKYNYPSSNCRTFVLVLSVVDLYTSLFGISFEILFLFREYNLHEWMCKASLFVNTVPTFTSGFLLLAIAFDRYRKVCKPFSWQISNINAKRMCLFTAIFGLACSWMTPLIHGIQTRKHTKYNITISECVETDAMKKTVFHLLNTSIFVVLFVFILATIIVIYCFIAVNVKRHHDRTKSLRSKSSIYCTEKLEDHELKAISGKVVLRKHGSKPGLIREYDDSSFCDSNTLCGGIEKSNRETEVLDAKRQTECDMNAEVKRAQDIEAEGKNAQDMDAEVKHAQDMDAEVKHAQDMDAEVKHAQAMNAEVKHAQDMDAEVQREQDVKKSNETLESIHSCTRSSLSSTETLSAAPRITSIKHDFQIKPPQRGNKFRTVFIMFLISLAFVISYLPFLCLLLIGAADDTFVINLKDGNETAYKFFLRSYLINCACNPVIYGLCDKRFRKHYKKFIAKWKITNN